jgi:hypothetical protein
MNHLTCDLCGGALSEVRFEMKIEIKAAYDALNLTEEDLARDIREEIANVLRQLEGLSAKDAQDQVYRAFEFDLCPACQRTVVRDPLATLKSGIETRSRRF